MLRATLYYQSMPPYYLLNRFRTAPNGDATRRLYYLTSNLTSNLNPAGTAVEGLEAEGRFDQRPSQCGAQPLTR